MTKLMIDDKPVQEGCYDTEILYCSYPCETEFTSLFFLFYLYAPRYSLSAQPSDLGPLAWGYPIITSRNKFLREVYIHGCTHSILVKTESTFPLPF